MAETGQGMYLEILNLAVPSNSNPSQCLRKTVALGLVATPFCSKQLIQIQTHKGVTRGRFVSGVATSSSEVLESVVISGGHFHVL